MWESEGSTEILVHITAPSSAADDIRYRALTLAYLEFEPQRIGNFPQDPSSYPCIPPPEVLISPQASFGNVWDNIVPPQLADRIEASQPADVSQSSWVAPPSEVPDSVPDNDISLPAFSTPTRVLSYFLQATEKPSVSSAESSVQRSRNAIEGSPSHTNASDGLPRDGSGPGSSPSARRTHSPLFYERQAIAPAEANTTHAPEEDSDTDNTPLSPTVRPKGPSSSGLDLLPGGQHASILGVHDWTHETQLISTEPAVATHRLGPRAPQHLERLAATMEMRRRYKPKYQARDMLSFERGYWLMRLDGWTFEEKVKAWGFLGNYIRREDKAGWGTRACRDESWDWIRLYGWEHIAGELYMLLYVASYRKVKWMEMKYYGASGNVLIVVEPRSSRQDVA